MSACLNAIENIAGRFFLCFCVFKSTTHIGMKDICIYFFSMYFLPHYPLDMVEIFFANNKIHGEGKSFRDVDFFLHHQILPVCSILERRQGFIFLCIFLLIVVCEALFYCNFFLCFYAFFLFACLLHRHRE